MSTFSGFTTVNGWTLCTYALQLFI